MNPRVSCIGRFFSRGRSPVRVARAGFLALALALTGCMTEDKGGGSTGGLPGDGPTDADKLPRVFAPAEPSAPEPVKFFPEEIRGRASDVHPDMAAEGGARLLESKRFVFNLFDDVSLVAETERVEIKEPGRFILHGRLAGVEGSWFTLTFNLGAIFATVRHPTRGQFEIEPTGALAGKVVEFDAHKLPLVNHRMMFPTGNHVHDHGGETMPALPKHAAATPVMDLLVVYTEAAVQGAGGEAAMLARIDKAVAETNTAFLNSRIDARLNLVKAVQVSYAEAGNMSTDLGRLQKTTDGFLDDVHALRTTYKADLVSLVVEQAGGVAGIAYVMTNVTTSFRGYAFSVVGRPYMGSGHVLAHELGHNFGAAHDRQNSTAPGAYSYSFGHRFNGLNGRQYRTIMAYPPGTGIPYYSNPNILYEGVATGSPEGQANSADNARTFNATAPVVAAFLAGPILPPTNLPPTASIVSPGQAATYMGGAVISYSGSGNDPETGGLPATALTWRVDFHKGAQVTSVVPPTAGSASGSFTVPVRGETSPDVFYRITLTVRDAAGLTGTAVRDVQPVKATVTLAGNPQGLKVHLDGAAVTTPHTFVAVAGMIRSLQAVSPQTLGTSTYAFKSWSDAGAAAHEITVPAAGATYTATYTVSGGGSSPWTSLDIGAVGIAGSVTGTAGAATVKGSGTDIWNAADAFHFAHRTLTHDGMITARVVSLDNTDPWAKAGVMIRENAAPESRNVFMAWTAGNGATFQRREATAGASVSTKVPVAAPIWVRLVRSGASIKGYRSSDGLSWTLQDETVQSLPPTVLVGLAVTSHNNAAAATAAFDNISITPDVWASNDVGVVAIPGSASGYGTVDVRGDGADIWGNADAFFFRHRVLVGDGEIKARVVSLQHTHSWAKAGVMIRESTAAGAKHAFTLVTPAAGAAFQRRVATGGGSTHTGIAGTAPSWVRVQRTGNVFTSSVSQDGATWTVIGTETIAMAAEVRVGLAVTSHSNGMASTAVFDQLTVTD